MAKLFSFDSRKCAYCSSSLRDLFVNASARTPMGGGCTCGDCSQSADIKLSSLLTKSGRNRAWIKRSEPADTGDISHAGEGVRMISGQNPEDSRFSRVDQKRTMSV
jgi:hypothetical protein